MELREAKCDSTEKSASELGRIPCRWSEPVVFFFEAQLPHLEYIVVYK
jgi:hypothetical protein